MAEVGGWWGQSLGSQQGKAGWLGLPGGRCPPSPSHTDRQEPVVQWLPMRQGGDREEVVKRSPGGWGTICIQGVSRVIKHPHSGMVTQGFYINKMPACCLVLALKELAFQLYV